MSLRTSDEMTRDFPTGNLCFNFVFEIRIHNSIKYCKQHHCCKFEGLMFVLPNLQTVLLEFLNVLVLYSITCILRNLLLNIVIIFILIFFNFVAI